LGERFIILQIRAKSREMSGYKSHAWRVEDDLPGLSITAVAPLSRGFVTFSFIRMKQIRISTDPN
jgi:hypothetical protein